MNTQIKQLIDKTARGQELTQAEVDAVMAVMPNEVAALQRTIEALTNWIREAIPAIVDAFSAFARMLAAENEVLSRCKCPRVVHLAKNAKKARVRNKNLRRAEKIVKEAER